MSTVLDPEAQRCRQCFGAGFVEMERGNDELCPRCKGTGCEPTAKETDDGKGKDEEEARRN